MSLFGKKTEPRLDPEPRVVEPRRAAPEQPRFGIDEAMRLLRSLPMDQNPSLVVLVVKNTLASLKVDVGPVIADGSKKQERLSARIAELRDAIAELERQIDVHRAEIATVEVDLAETTTAKERLELAQRGEVLPPPVPSAPPARGRSVKPASFPKPPPRAPLTDPPPAPPREPVPEPEDSKDGPESDLLAMLPDEPSSRSR